MMEAIGVVRGVERIYEDGVLVRVRFWVARADRKTDEEQATDDGAEAEAEVAADNAAQRTVEGYL